MTNYFVAQLIALLKDHINDFIVQLRIMTTHYCFMDIRIKFGILSFDFYHLEVLEGFFKLTADFLHALDNGLHIIALFDACFCTLKVIENLQEFANHVCGNKGGKLFLLCISAATEVFKISLQTQ